jgi:sporulation protein YlmC with PRC-barrel domain
MGLLAGRYGVPLNSSHIYFVVSASIRRFEVNARKLFNKQVIDAQGNNIGRVADIDFDMVNGVINHIIVTAGLIKKYEIKLDKIMTTGDKVILKIQRDELQKK